MFNRRQLVGLAMSLCLGMGIVGLADAAQELKKVDFITRGNGTEIQLHANASAYRTLLTSHNKMILEFDDVSAGRNIGANFAQARNISHVTFQPVDESRIRVIIRGENLGKPSVRFIEPPTAEIAADGTSDLTRELTRLREETESAIAEADALSVEPEAVDTSTEGTTATETPAEEPVNIPAVEPVASVDDISTMAGAAAPIIRPQTPETGGLETLSMADFNFPTIDKGLIWPIAQGGVLLSLMLGLGLFIRRKMNSLQENSADPANSDGLSFRKVAQAKRRQKQAPAAKKDKLFSPDKHPKKANTWASRPKRPAQAAAKPDMQALLELAHSAGNNNPTLRSKGAPTPQALNTYQKQAASPKKPATRRKPAATPSGQKAIRKDAARQQKDITKKMAGKRPQQAQPRNSIPSNGEPLSGNPQVLDFLKNVADLMEQNGETGKARRIQRGLEQ